VLSTHPAACSESPTSEQCNGRALQARERLPALDASAGNFFQVVIGSDLLSSRAACQTPWRTADRANKANTSIGGGVVSVRAMHRGPFAKPLKRISRQQVRPSASHRTQIAANSPTAVAHRDPIPTAGIVSGPAQSSSCGGLSHLATSPVRQETDSTPSRSGREVGAVGSCPGAATCPAHGELLVASSRDRDANGGPGHSTAVFRCFAILGHRCAMPQPPVAADSAVPR
jgi:hypothetical protein